MAIKCGLKNHAQLLFLKSSADKSKLSPTSGSQSMPLSVAKNRVFLGLNLNEKKM